jgi:hypothetical protein
LLPADFAGANTEVVVDVRGVTLQSQSHAIDALAVGSTVTLNVGARWVVAFSERVDDAHADVAPPAQVADRTT